MRPEKIKSTFEPLETQIARWWLNLHQTLRERAFHISEITEACRDRFRDKPALRDVAAALRQWGGLVVSAEKLT